MKKLRRNPLVRVFADSRAQWPGATVILLLVLLAGAFKVASSMYWGRAVDAGVGGNNDVMLNSVLFMLLFILLDGGRTAILYATIGRVTEQMFLNVRMRAFAVLTNGDVAALEHSLRSGDLAMRVNGDAEALCDFVAAEVPNNLRLIVQAIAAIVVCVFLSWQLSIAYLVILPVTLWLTRVISLPVQQARKDARGSAGQGMNLASDMLSAIQTVKSFGISAVLQNRFNATLDRSYEQGVGIERTAMRLTVVKYTASVVQLMSLFLIGTVLTAKGLVTIGNVMAFVSLSAYISEAFGQLDRMMLVVRNASAYAQRLYEVFDIPAEEDGGSAVPSADAAAVSLHNVSFSYGQDRSAIDGMTLRVLRNQKVALIGPSGCGKSTLTRLICRFYAPTGGELALFGEEASRLSLSALRGQIALVTQEAHLFDGTIEDNVRHGRPNATVDEVIAALQNAGLWEFVSSLPQGLHTQIGEFGGQLSGGQRQRLCIARAFLKDAKLIILDEATSALDTDSERDIQTSLDRLLVGRSAILVAHRMTTVQNADYIYCLDAGRIVEEGYPSQLLERRGYYYAMCEQQGLLSAKGGAA